MCCLAVVSNHNGPDLVRGRRNFTHLERSVFLVVQITMPLTFSCAVVAYYERNKVLLVLLLLLLAGNLSAIIGMVATSLPQARFESNDIPAFHAGSCIGITIPLKFNSFW